jgi:hypothetical protein
MLRPDGGLVLDLRRVFSAQARHRLLLPITRDASMKRSFRINTIAGLQRTRLAVSS